MIRAVVVGSGSAGRRHTSTLRALLPDADIVVVRRTGSNTPDEWLSAADVRVLGSVAEAATMEPDLGLIASPSPFHREAADTLLASGAHVLVEKPLAATLEDATAMVAAAERLGRPLVVGYHLRCADTPKAMARLLTDGMVGEVREFRLEVGQHLAQWRSAIDPRQSVTARRELGGGVLLELSHELDAAAWLFGAIDKVDADLGFGGAPTDGTVDTVADLALRTAAGIEGRVHLDMVSATPVRRWSAVGTAGTLTADLIAGRVSRRERSGSDEQVLLQVEAGERDRAEMRVITNLLDVAAGSASPVCTGADGVAAVAVVEAARASASDGGPVKVSRRIAGEAVRWT